MLTADNGKETVKLPREHIDFVLSSKSPSSDQQDRDPPPEERAPKARDAQPTKIVRSGTAKRKAIAER